MKYFTQTHYTTSDLDKEYRKLVKIHHPDKPSGDTTRFQELQEEYEAEMFRIKNPSIIDNKIYQSIRAGADVMLKQMGLKPANELIPDKLCDLIDKIKIPTSLEKHKPLAKIIITSQFGDVDDIISTIEQIYITLKRKNK